MRHLVSGGFIGRIKRFFDFRIEFLELLIRSFFPKQFQFLTRRHRIRLRVGFRRTESDQFGTDVLDAERFVRTAGELSRMAGFVAQRADQLVIGGRRAQTHPMSGFVASAETMNAGVEKAELEAVFGGDRQRFQSARGFRQTVDQRDHARLVFLFAFGHVDIDGRLGGSVIFLFGFILFKRLL